MKYLKTHENKEIEPVDMINKIKSGTVEYIKVIGKNKVTNIKHYTLIMYVNYQKGDSEHYPSFNAKYNYIVNGDVNTTHFGEDQFFEYLRDSDYFTTANETEIEDFEIRINTKKYNL